MISCTRLLDGYSEGHLLRTQFRDDEREPARLFSQIQPTAPQILLPFFFFFVVYSQVDISILPQPYSKGSPNPDVNAGGKRRGTTTAASNSVHAFHIPVARKTRSRGAKRSAVYAGLSAYSTHFSDLVSMELKHEKVSWLVRERRMRAESACACVFG